MTPTNPEITILVVDDEPSIRLFLTTVLALEGFAVLQAENGVLALRQCEQSQPQLLILDIAMPELDGLQVLRQLRRQRNNAPVIMLTSRSAENDKVQAFSEGADDYLTKPFSSSELVMRVKAVLRRAEPKTPARPADELVVDDIRINVQAGRASIGGRPLDLTRTELLLLLEMAREPGKPLPDGQLLARVWGVGYADDTEILRATIWRLRRQIEANPSVPRYILRRRGQGYQLGRPEMIRTIPGSL